MKASAGITFAGLFLLAILGEPIPTAAQEIRGTLRDARTRLPVPAGEIRMYSTTGSVLARVVTDSVGEFRIRTAREGTYGIAAVHVRFPPTRRDTVHLAANEVVTVTLFLDTAVILAPLVVNARVQRSQGWLDLFRERRQFFEPLGAKFFTRADFEGIAAGTPSEVITSLVPNYFFDANPLPGRLGHPPGRPRLAIRRFNNVCEPRYYINYHAIRIDRRAEPEARIEDFLELRHVTAIEIYRPGAARPGEVADGCGGAIIFWTVGPDSALGPGPVDDAAAGSAHGGDALPRSDA